MENNELINLFFEKAKEAFLTNKSFGNFTITNGERVKLISLQESYASMVGKLFTIESINTGKNYSILKDDFFENTVLPFSETNGNESFLHNFRF